METWFIIVLPLSLCLLFNSLFSILKPAKKLPPGPFTIPIITNFLWLFKSFTGLESILHNLRAKYGPIITLSIGYRPAIFIASNSLAHQTLIQNGAIFADRPPAFAINKILNISSAPYGPTWRLLRRNLTSGILHPSRIKSYSQARKRVLEILINRLKPNSKTGEHVPVKCLCHFQYAMFCLLVLICFGDKVEEDKIKQIEQVQRQFLRNASRFSMLIFWPSLTKVLLYIFGDEFVNKLRRDQEIVLIPLIRARKNSKIGNLGKDKEDHKLGKEEFIVSYVDTLLDLHLPEENRKLEEGEMVTLCSEFLVAGGDSTASALQWIMANLVKYPHIQEKLFMEINEVVGAEEEEVKEDYLQRMPYLKAVILEGLRRHPNGPFLLPYAVTQDTIVDGFVVPRNGTVNFLIREIGWDPKVWEDPMVFKPERFLNIGEEVFDITGSKEIKMMPFGAGRRMCPGYGLAMLHLEYFVANLVWNFNWMAVDGDDVDLSEKEEFSVVMKNPLKAHISPRIRLVTAEY